MKSKLIISILLGILAFAFIYKNSGVGREEKSSELVSNYAAVPSPGGGQNHFLQCVMSDGNNQNFHNISDLLGLNTWHVYCNSEVLYNKHYPSGWILNNCPDDILFTTDNTYTANVKTELNTISGNNMQALMCRPKIEYLCYGQRSDYMCASCSHFDPDLWFYSFQSPIHVGQDVPDTDSGGDSPGAGQLYVRYCRYSNSTNQGNWVDNAGIVDNRLKANTEQCHRQVGYGDDYRWDSQCTWYLKPRIRIDSTIAHNPSNPQVCELKVIGSDGQTILKDVNIYAINFLDNNGNYNGSYLEQYFSHPSNSIDLTIQGDWVRGDTTLNSWYGCARGTSPTDNNGAAADIQITWSGQCDAWFEYVRVDNDIADGLFKGVYDNTWLQWEGQDIALNNSAAFTIYIQLFEFNQVPCVSYVSKKLEQYSKKPVSVMADQPFLISDVALRISD